MRLEEFCGESFAEKYDSMKKYLNTSLLFKTVELYDEESRLGKVSFFSIGDVGLPSRSVIKFDKCSVADEFINKILSDVYCYEQIGCSDIGYIILNGERNL